MVFSLVNLLKPKRINKFHPGSVKTKQSCSSEAASKAAATICNLPLTMSNQALCFTCINVDVWACKRHVL